MGGRVLQRVLKRVLKSSKWVFAGFLLGFGFRVVGCHVLRVL